MLCQSYTSHAVPNAPSVHDQIAQGLMEHPAKKVLPFNILVTILEIGGSITLFHLAQRIGASDVGNCLVAASPLSSAGSRSGTRPASSAEPRPRPSPSPSLFRCHCSGRYYTPKVLLYKDCEATVLIGLVFLPGRLGRSGPPSQLGREGDHTAARFGAPMGRSITNRHFRLGLDARRATKVRARRTSSPASSETSSAQRESAASPSGPQFVLDRPGRCALVRKVVDPAGGENDRLLPLAGGRVGYHDVATIRRCATTLLAPCLVMPSSRPMAEIVEPASLEHTRNTRPSGNLVRRTPRRPWLGPTEADTRARRAGAPHRVRLMSTERSMCRRRGPRGRC